jgi:hypothetical protein
VEDFLHKPCEKYVLYVNKDDKDASAEEKNDHRDGDDRSRGCPRPSPAQPEHREEETYRERHKENFCMRILISEINKLRL